MLFIIIPAIRHSSTFFFFFIKDLEEWMLWLGRLISLFYNTKTLGV